MPPRSRRKSSAAAPPILHAPAEPTPALEVALLQLSATLLNPVEPRSTFLTQITAGVRATTESLINSPESSRARDTFRHLNGFTTLLDSLRAASGYYHPTQHTQAENLKLFDLLAEVLGLLSKVFQGHHGNRRFFKKRVEGDGWAALEQAIASIGFGGSDADVWSENQLFGLLLSFAVDDERLRSLCHKFQSQDAAHKSKHLVAASKVGTNESKNKGKEKIEKGGIAAGVPDDHEFATLVEAMIYDTLKDSDLLRNPEIIPTVIAFWKALPRDRPISEAPASLSVILILSKIASFSQHNLLALHATGILSDLLPFAFEDATTLNSHEKPAVERLCGSLMSAGLSNLDDARYLLCSKSTKAAEFLLRMTKATQNPPHIQFDLSLFGYASIELPTIGRPFPPASSLPGYTFTAWIYIDQFDPHAHTTIFGAFDSSQTCFVLGYLEKDTHNFILQTSVTSSRPSVRFKSTLFRDKTWYHIAIVHRRSKTMMSSSKAALYVNGEFAEQVKSQYPVQPPQANTVDGASSSAPSLGSKLNPVQAFIGTPQDLSSKIGRRMVSSRWSLASAHLFEDALSDDLIAVHYRLGARYNGNFQDCLGSFQTYEASAALGMRNELMHPGKDEKSELLTAIKDKGSMLIPESRLLLSILPTAVLTDETQGSIDVSQLMRGLSRKASSNLFQLVRSSSGPIAINTAVPSIDDALTKANGTAILTGDPVVVVPQAIDDAMWRLGGCTAIGMKLVEEASSKEEIIRAVEILFESIKGSWRNSEAMERENGYAILAAIIRGKLGAGVVISSANENNGSGTAMSVEERNQLGFELLSLVLGFVGYNHETPEDSFITNPMAYRILLIDFEMWRKTNLDTQRLYFKQFTTFAVSSKYHHFNSRRLLRMRIVKRFLEALRAEDFLPDAFPSFMEAFSTMVKCNLNVDVFRSLALFVTYSLHKPSVSLPRTPKTTRHGTVSASSRPGSIHGTPRRLTVATPFDSKAVSTKYLTKRQLGTSILEMYADLLCEKGSTVNLKKFARTVTNKWLLHLLTEDDPQIVVLGTKILSRLLVVHGSGYVTKFVEKTGGFVIMRHRLKRWWDIPTLWPICFSILFNHDVAEIDFERSFELFTLLETFDTRNVVYPQVLPVIMAMLQQGLNSLLRTQDNTDSPIRDINNIKAESKSLAPPDHHSRRRSMSLTKELESRQLQKTPKERLGGQANVLHAVIRFFAELHGKSQNFRDFATSSNYVRLLLGIIYPVIVSADVLSPETELNSRDSTLTFDGDDVIIRASSNDSAVSSPIVRTASVETLLANSATFPPKTKALRRGSSFILLSSAPIEFSPSAAKLSSVASPKSKIMTIQVSNAVVEGILELVIGVFMDQVLARKEFPGFGIFVRVPPGFQEHQAYFESYVLRNTISHLMNTIQLDQKLLWEPRVITNMARFSVHMSEAVYEGWFLGGAEPLLDFVGNVLEYLQRPDVAMIKSVRLCSQAIKSTRAVFLRVVLLRLSEIESPNVSEKGALEFMDKLLFWQTVVLSSEISEDDFLKLVCYQLYTKLVDSRDKIRLAAANLWRILLVQKPEETSVILATSMEKKQLVGGFKKLMELDNETFIEWVDEHRADLDALFFGAMAQSWEEFVNVENSKTAETSKSRVGRRRERLKQWHTEFLHDEDILFRHELASNLWMKNIYASEHLKHQRALQDQQDNLSFLGNSFSKMDRDLHRTCAVFDKAETVNWKLDLTEGRNRMRLRMLPDRSLLLRNYQPKRKMTDMSTKSLNLDTRIAAISVPESGTTTPTDYTATNLADLDGSTDRSDKISVNVPSQTGDEDASEVMAEEDFELVDDPNDPNEGEDGYEDKNRKVMRSLNRGDQVKFVFNISRIIGLEACEGLLILGKDSLYLIDNVFQRSDGEIVNVWNAPVDERDPYLQLIAGQKSNDKRPQILRGEQESRSWKWSDVLSISKRRFLFRDVALEVFFTDGRSYLLTAITHEAREDLHSKLTSKAPLIGGNTSSSSEVENAWRLESLRVSDETPTTFGSKFGNIFNSSAWNPAMRRWAKGEISNFHYLMLVNTMAGRTFNDLTQYPVFPWVLADYTSDELDLDNPSTFRDLSKPMGAQNPTREAEFVERYKSFAEMGDQPAFHYGTHYSSAMIVTSYLIRLEPFVQSYLLLQGGSFDHPDRLFYSIEKAWASASCENMTDVRELVPEFYYLSEFLTNNNGYNFGVRQGSGGSIDTVELPPWAKGDPKIFIAKHREALESPYVSRNLHLWIDLVFGSKQRGEAAIENTNVFHHLSYHGATNLDRIEDPIERLATIGIIHNFGQTPHQVFSKSHQPRDDTRHKARRLDTSAGFLTRLPFPLFENHESIASLTYSTKLDRLLCATAFRINMPPHYDKYLEWGYADNSIRFFTTEKKMVGLFENLHQGQLSCAIFVDSSILITAGVDCVITAWNVSCHSSKSVELAPKTSLFGHRHPVSTLAVSRSFSTILSASTDGQVLLWDLNRLEFVRKLASGRPVECGLINDVSGDIILCRGQKVALYTLNGDLLLDQNVCNDHDDHIFSCAFYEGVGNEWLENGLIFTGHRRGVVNVWNKCIRNGSWALELVKRLDHVDQRAENGGNTAAAITCINPMAQVVYTGDEDGRVYEWDCVQRERRER